MSDSDQETLTATIPGGTSPQRLDRHLGSLFPEYSRSRLQRWIGSGQVRVNGEVVTKNRLTPPPGALIEVTPEQEDEGDWLPEPIELKIIYADEHIIVLNKPDNIVVHPAAGNRQGTLLNGLIYRYPELIQIPRAGIVHRLDKDTSGLMVVARTLQAQNSLVQQLQERTVKREYRAIVSRPMTGGGVVNQPLGRHPVDRKKMAVVHSGKEAITHYRLQERFEHFSYLSLQLETGRTHQIRVHMAWLRHPLVGDRTYGGRLQIPAGIEDELKQSIRQYPHQALHAVGLGLIHPLSGELMEWQSELPAEMEALLSVLRRNDLP